MVTASGSGLDPHISFNTARAQAPRVAKAREMEPGDIWVITAKCCTEVRTFGVLGEPRVNVLKLNLALDAFQKKSPPKK
jgi:K+-transporting ATPase ATPase C chain